ncbi:MAG: hypothetical protein HY273_15395 [Gammaproteobacteria bacterium]|nr:hypothetical protein [Gammaproteobacteria bacterium]
MKLNFTLVEIEVIPIVAGTTVRHVYARIRVTRAVLAFTSATLSVTETKVQKDSEIWAIKAYSSNSSFKTNDKKSRLAAALASLRAVLAVNLNPCSP